MQRGIHTIAFIVFGTLAVSLCLPQAAHAVGMTQAAMVAASIAQFERDTEKQERKAKELPEKDPQKKKEEEKAKKMREQLEALRGSNESVDQRKATDSSDGQGDPKPTDSKPTDAKPTDSKSTENQPTDSKTAEATPQPEENQTGATSDKSAEKPSDSSQVVSPEELAEAAQTPETAPSETVPAETPQTAEVEPTPGHEAFDRAAQAKQDAETLAARTKDHEQRVRAWTDKEGKIYKYPDGKDAYAKKYAEDSAKSAKVREQQIAKGPMEGQPERVTADNLKNTASESEVKAAKSVIDRMSKEDVAAMRSELPKDGYEKASNYLKEVEDARGRTPQENWNRATDESISSTAREAAGREAWNEIAKNGNMAAVVGKEDFEAGVQAARDYINSPKGDQFVKDNLKNIAAASKGDKTAGQAVAGSLKEALTKDAPEFYKRMGMSTEEMQKYAASMPDDLKGKIDASVMYPKESMDRAVNQIAGDLLDKPSVKSMVNSEVAAQVKANALGQAGKWANRYGTGGIIGNKVTGAVDSGVARATPYAQAGLNDALRGSPMQRMNTGSIEGKAYTQAYQTGAARMTTAKNNIQTNLGGALTKPINQSLAASGINVRTNVIGTSKPAGASAFPAKSYLVPSYTTGRTAGGTPTRTTVIGTSSPKSALETGAALARTRSVLAGSSLLGYLRSPASE